MAESSTEIDWIKKLGLFKLQPLTENSMKEIKTELKIDDKHPWFKLPWQAETEYARAGDHQQWPWLFKKDAYGITAANLNHYLMEIHSSGSAEDDYQPVAIIYLRSDGEGGDEMGKQIIDAYHLPMTTDMKKLPEVKKKMATLLEGPEPSNAKFSAKDLEALLFQSLLQKQVVIFHCTHGVERTPVVASTYSANFLLAKKWHKDTEQKICLLFGGFAGFKQKSEEIRPLSSNGTNPCSGSKGCRSHIKHVYVWVVAIVVVGSVQCNTQEMLFNRLIKQATLEKFLSFSARARVANLSADLNYLPRTVFCVPRVLWFEYTAEASLVHPEKRWALPDLMDATILELQEGLARYDFTSVDLIKAYFARIEEVNLQGPMLRAVIETNPSALEQAAALDEEREMYGARGPLHGIPILVKDNIATMAAEGMNTTAGSYALLGSIVPGDSTIAAKLRRAGAIILGKANLSEWAHYRGNTLASGWSGRGGQCTNPYYPGADPCGSSSGSAVAAAIGLAAGTLGSETDGSIVCPSNQQALAGIKPTVGLTSRSGVIPISEHQDTVGPICRWMADSAALLTVIAGRDVKDNYTLAQPRIVPDYTMALNKTALAGARIGVPRVVFTNDSYTGNDPYVNVVFAQAIEIIKSMGATIVDPADLPSALEIANSNNETIVLNTDFKIDVNRYLANLVEVPTGVRSLADLIAYDSAYPNLELPTNYSDQSIFIESQATTGFNSSYYTSLYDDYALGRSMGIDAALQTYNLDALILPAPGYTTTPAAIAGYPIVTVPMGFYPANVTIQSAGPVTVYPAPGVPIGIAFLGTAYSEFKLISYGYAYEQKTMTRLLAKPYAAAIPTTQLADVMGK